MGAPTFAASATPGPGATHRPANLLFNNQQQPTNNVGGGGGGGAKLATASTTDTTYNANPGGRLEETYTALIQEYLQVMCLENAIFLAERMVATFPGSTHARYLLGVCHYRARAPQRALAVLESISLPTPAASYVMAKCCFDLKQYNRAEEILLEAARINYQQYKLSVGVAAEQGSTYDHASADADAMMTMDEWLVETSPCPVPNGAAGLYLLGNICRRSTQKQRAMKYYRLSLQVLSGTPTVWLLVWFFFFLFAILTQFSRFHYCCYNATKRKLDPLMWVSYEALCEMGASGIDPTSVFGVRPKEIDHLRESFQRQQQQQDSQESMPLQEKAVLTPHQFTPPVGAAMGASLVHPAAGMSMMGGCRPMDLGTPIDASSIGPMASLFQTASKAPTVATHAHTGGQIRPSQLQFDTPNLTPIPMQQDASFVKQQHYQQRVPRESQAAQKSIESSLDFADSFNPETVRRAKHVAARLYYQPSPETPDFHSRFGGTDGRVGDAASFSVAPSSPRRYLRGKSASLWSTTLEPAISETPLRRGRPSDISTTRRPRALFLSEHKAMRENTNDLNQNVTGRESFGGSVARGGPAVPTEDEENFRRPPSDEIVIDRGDNPHDENDDEQPTLDDDDDDDDDVLVEDPENQQHQPHDEKPVNMSTKGTNQQELAIAMEEDAIMDRHGCVQQILELFCLMGAGYWRLCQFRCREALQVFGALPQTHHNTGWVLHYEGRAYFEMADYQKAQRSLQLMERVEPYRMKGLELLSTVLWQLKKEVDLAHLAQRAVDFDRLSPEAWCVVGNCFSLQKEHETALVFFGRSLQLDPSFTYTHTLSGYEYMANEDFEKATSCFRNAILADERHYNAWYGMGAIYHRQEKYELAEYHFQRAVDINPQSSVLRCNLGMSQYASGKSQQALDTLSEAFRLDPQNPQARFQRATIYLALNRPWLALTELEKVRDAAPREATVHFAMGKVLKRLGRPQEAMRCFLTALDLDPKDNQLIKSAMDKLDEPDMDEEVAAF